MSARPSEEFESSSHGGARKRMRGSLDGHEERQRYGWYVEDWAIVPYRPPTFPLSIAMDDMLSRYTPMPQPVAYRNCPPGFRIHGTKVGPPPKNLNHAGRSSERQKGKATVTEHRDTQLVLLSDSEEEEAAAKNAAGASSSRAVKKSGDVGLERKDRKHARKEVEGQAVEKIYAFDPNAPELNKRNPPRTRVKYVLRSFDDLRRHYLAEDQRKGKESGPKRPDLKAYSAFADFRVNGRESIVGKVPGVEVGDHYYFRMELLLISLHRQSQGGIDYIPESKSPYKDRQGRRVAVAVSVIASGGYEDDKDEGNVLIYTGSGGNISKNNHKPAIDQQLLRGNLGLKNCRDLGIAVRVIRGFENNKSARYPAPGPKVYVYDGLYDVTSADLVPGAQGLKVWQFKLVRQPGQGPQTSLVLFKKKSNRNILDGLGEQVLMEDIACGREPSKIRLVGFVGESVVPDTFTYISKSIFAPGVMKPKAELGCACSGSCLLDRSCRCIYLGDDGTDNYNEEGCLLLAKRMVYECGPLCHCAKAPDRCSNRVTQHGLRYDLEVFRTRHKGWGVRSRQFISQGSFICEYVGQIIRDVDAEARVARDDYMFDLMVPKDMESRYGLAALGRRKVSSKLEDEEGSLTDDKFTADARQYGNLARFINHSCDPNLFVQCVFYDHHDQRLPHIMLFASEHISPYVELTYDYGYTIDKVTVNGETMVKHCYCGGKSCSGRLY